MLTQLAREHPKTDQLGPVCEQEDSSLEKSSVVTQEKEMIELKQESAVPTEEAKKTWSWKGDV